MAFRYKLNDIFVTVTYIAIGLIFVGNSFGHSNITSMGTYALAISCLGYGGFLITKSIRQVNIQTFLVLTLIVSVIVSSTANSQASTIEFLLFLMLPVYIVICSYSCDSESDTKKLYIASVAYFLIQLLAALSSNSHTAQSRWGAYQSSYLTLNYPNPNQTAMILMPLFFVHMTFLLGESLTKRKIVDLCICAIEFAFIFMTGSRTGIVLSVIAIVLLVSGIYRHLGKKYGYICLIIPAAAVILMTVFPQLSTAIQFMNDALDTGRGEHYLSVIRSMTPITFLFGDFSKYSGRNMMNGYITISAEYGFCELLVYYIVLLLRIKTLALAMPSMDDRNRYGFCLLCLLLVQTAMEAAYLTSGTVYAALVFLILRCSISSKPTSEKL
mgnify:CR=1 FL=1